ncbi:RNA-binding domain-containing protein [Fibrobacter sp.]|uniref:RNA-binding domain-containing protein n=1 Tax=Fibrobacter sp. TaxID=35828 RepID=UPI00386A5BEF
MGDLLKDFNIDSFREGNRFEAKLAKGGFPKSLWETYSSFANTDGGLILLGVKENRDHTFTIEGVENPERMEKLFWDNVNNKNVVNINILGNNNVEIKDINGKKVFWITVPRADRIYRPVFKGTDMFTGTFRRNGEGDYLCSREEVGSLYRDAGHISQDCKIVKEVDLGSLSKETITHYRQRFRLSHDGHVWNYLPDIEFLKKIGAARINQDDGMVYPTAAGLLMFGYESEIVYEYPLYFLDYQEHFDETTRWSDRFVSSSGEWSGNVFDFFFKTVNKLSEDISGGTSDPRNATILKMFSMIDIGERAGSGIPGVFSVWEKEFGLKPEYTQKISLERTITVLKLAEIAQRTSDNCPENVEIAQRNSENCPENDLILPPNCPEIAQRTYLAIATNPYATIEELSEKMDVSPRTVKYHIALLRDKFIKRIGSDTKGYWEIIEENHQQGEII